MVTTADQSNSAREVVLEVGAEGGSLTLSRERAQDGRWRFRLERNETTLRDVLLDDDQSTRSHGFAEDRYASSLDQALTLLDQYPWFRLFPLQVHPQFLDSVLNRLRRRGGEPEENRSRETLNYSKPFGTKEALKDGAYAFLRSLEESLNAKLPPPAELRQNIREIVKLAKKDAGQKHLNEPEYAFLYRYAVPTVFDCMQTVLGIGEVESSTIPSIKVL